MNQREQAVQQARKLISDDLLIEFFRAVGHDNQVFAVQLINQHLDKGETLDRIFYTGEDFGFLLSIQQLPDSAFSIAFGCQAGPLAGDGGDWKVAFDDRGQVCSLSGGFSWIS